MGERGPLMLSLRPRLIPTTCPMVMEIQLMGMDMVFMERGLLMLSQRPSLMSMEDTTQLTDTMDTERGLLRLSQRPSLMSMEDTTDTLLTDTTSMESRQLPF